MYRMGSSAAVAALTSVFLVSPAMAQTGSSLRVTRVAVVLEGPRGDSVVVGAVDPGTILEVLEQEGSWYRVSPPEGTSGQASWRRGWIHGGSIQLTKEAHPRLAPRGRMLIRGFGQASGTVFTARDSFDAILGRTFGSMYGGGGQIAFPNGAFAQVNLDRFTKTGSRALVSGTQIFRLPIPDSITVTPLQVTAGYRAASSGVSVPYVGAGIGWHILKEESTSVAGLETARDGHLGYQILGGAEFQVLSWFWVAGEVQWATVPKALGDTGVSAFFQEDDLGGTTFRFKLMLGY